MVATSPKIRIYVQHVPSHSFDVPMASALQGAMFAMVTQTVEMEVTSLTIQICVHPVQKINGDVTQGNAFQELRHVTA